MTNIEFRVPKNLKISEFFNTKMETNALVLEFRIALKHRIMHIILQNGFYDHLVVNSYIAAQTQLIADQSKEGPHKIIYIIIY